MAQPAQINVQLTGQQAQQLAQQQAQQQAQPAGQQGGVPIQINANGALKGNPLVHFTGDQSKS